MHGNAMQPKEDSRIVGMGTLDTSLIEANEIDYSDRLWRYLQWGLGFGVFSVVSTRPVVTRFLRYKGYFCSTTRLVT